MFVDDNNQIMYFTKIFIMGFFLIVISSMFGIQDMRYDFPDNGNSLVEINLLEQKAYSFLYRQEIMDINISS